jgi:hypothetical protein
MLVQLSFRSCSALPAAVTDYISTLLSAIHSTITVVFVIDWLMALHLPMLQFCQLHHLDCVPHLSRAATITTAEQQRHNRRNIHPAVSVHIPGGSRALHDSSLAAAVAFAFV